MTVQLGRMQFDDGSEELCVILDDTDALRVGHFQLLAQLERGDLDAYDLIIDLAEAFHDRSLSVGFEA